MFIQSKENIMTYFNGTLQEFTYLHEQVTEISNPDESYLGTLNLFFKEPVTSNDEQTYFEESNAFEQYVKDYINNNIIQGFVQNFIEDFNIYLEREYCEY